MKPASARTEHIGLSGWGRGDRRVGIEAVHVYDCRLHPSKYLVLMRFSQPADFSSDNNQSFFPEGGIQQ